jgi:hypothetical protein
MQIEIQIQIQIQMQIEIQIQIQIQMQIEIQIQQSSGEERKRESGSILSNDDSGWVSPQEQRRRRWVQMIEDVLLRGQILEDIVGTGLEHWYLGVNRITHAQMAPHTLAEAWYPRINLRKLLFRDWEYMSGNSIELLEFGELSQYCREIELTKTCQIHATRIV